MLYQRKDNADEKKDQKSKEKNNEKKIVTTTTIEKTITEKKPILTSKPVNISTTMTENKEIKKNEKTTTQVSYTKTEIESSLSMDKKPKFRVYLSSRYRGPKQNEMNSKLDNKITSIEETENNIHTLNVRKSPDNILNKRNFIETEKELNMNNIDNSQYSFNQINYEKDSNRINLNENILINNTSPKNKRFRQPMIPQNIVSPIKNYDDGNSLYDNQKYSETNTKVVNNIITNTNTNTKIDNMKINYPNTTNQKESRNIEQKIKVDNSSSYNKKGNSQNSNTVSYKELKRIVKRFNKVYDPFKNDKGLLIKQSQVTLPGASDEIFNNRYRVLSKMNKLSNILLAKKKKIEEDNNYINNNIKEGNKYEIGRNKNNDFDSKNKNINVKKDKKLLFFSLAMITSKGLNDKDKIILRNMRNEKGGVVDLAQDKIRHNKFKIKKATKVSGGDKKIKRYNQKEKEKAAKTIQSWWKELKDIYNYKLSKIIKIQSMWKGFWVRRNIYDLLYLNYLYLSFCEKIEKILTRKITRNAFDKLIMYKNNNNSDSNTNTNKDKNESEKEIKEEINVNGKKIIKITKITESERIISPIKKDKIIEKDKFKGLLKILEGVNNYHKKQAYDATKPKITKFLKILAKKEILKKIINKRITITHNILKKIIYKWLTKTTITKNTMTESTEKEKTFYTNIKGKLFYRRIENVKNKQKKILLRKYFYRYLKKVFVLGKKEDGQKISDLSDINKNDENEKNILSYNYNSKIKNIFSLSSDVINKNKITDLNNANKHIEALKILEKFMRRKTYKYVYECFMKKIKKELIIKNLIKIIKIKEKTIQYINKKYINKWINNSFIKKKNDLISKMFIKIIKIIIENRQKKILSKKFYQWRRIVNTLKGKDNMFLKSKVTYDFTEHIKKFINKKYATFFINRLNNINKKISIDFTLKKNIIKQNDRKNNILLKKSFNKWKNKVADFEIGRLKGKLLLKMYDKYRVIKKKEIIKKKLYKWENNTIFMDKIKNKINDENIDNLTKRNNNNKIIILKSIIRNNHRKNTDIILRKFFNIWKNNTKDQNLKDIEIINDNIKENALKNILIKYGKLISKNKIKQYYFSRWLYIAKSLRQIEFANVIQNFCHIHLNNKLIKNKWNKLFELLINKIKKKYKTYIRSNEKIL